MKNLFLSSCFADPVGQRLHLRDRIRELTGGASRDAAAARPVWMAEDYPELHPSSPWPEIEKAAFCLDGVREAECFVAILTRRHGSAITVDNAGTVPTSFFEAELFEAAPLEKPSFVFLLEGFEPDDRLASLLKLLVPFFPNMELMPISEDEILRKIDKLIRNYQRPRWLRSLLSPPQLGSTVYALFRARHHPYDVTADTPPLRFLNGLFDPTLPKPDPTQVEALLRQAEAAPRNQVRLMLIWFAIRALMGAPFTDPAFAELLPQWLHAFGAWTRAGAWYGLHGHTGMGCLAALGAISAIQLRMMDDVEVRHRIPHGPLASEYYSTARLAGNNRELLELALQHIEIAIDGSPERMNARAIRASIYRELGNLPAALADYEAITNARRDAGGAGFGEAQNELGFALLLAGQRRRGLKLMEQGVSLLKEGPPSGGQIRAIRKLAVGHLRSGHPFAALDLAAEAYDLATEIGAYDQIRQLERLAKHVERLRLRTGLARSKPTHGS
jgi:tetratricopeptide (TPR) repeat protein